jgi:hypothetical protein
MTVGYPVDKNQLDATAGQVCRLIEQWAPQALKMKQFLDETADETLMDPPFSYSVQDIAILKSGFTDLALLARIYQGNDILTDPRDLGAFARRMAGIFV